MAKPDRARRSVIGSMRGREDALTVHARPSAHTVPTLHLKSPSAKVLAGGADDAMVFETFPEKYPSFGPDPPYSLPPMTLLPIEFSRRKASKRKRDKEKGDAKKDEWQPMGLNKWAAVLKANPVHPKLAKASKCLSTRDWSVCIVLE